jgi:hypothetical protein
METEIKPRTKFFTHEEMCEMFGLPRTVPAPHWTPYAVRNTVIEVLSDSKCIAVFGGAMECGKCGFGLSMPPDEHTTPKANADGSCPKCGYLGLEKP